VAADRRVELRRNSDYFEGRFLAMGSPCSVLTRAASESEAQTLVDALAAEAWRVEDKFSRYLPGNIVDRINCGAVGPVAVDEETANLLDFAASLHAMSDGLFDITSGLLRKAWTFDGGDRVPAKKQIASLLARIGWRRVSWERPTVTLEAGMEIDFGGVGKEYAVDRAAGIAAEISDRASLLNFGGDIFAVRTPGDTKTWQVGIEALEGAGQKAERVIRLGQGALATSGDARRFVLHEGIRYGHILDPTTGWPVRDAPRSITVAADTCTQAGMLATLAILSGANAERFLEAQGVKFWCQR